MRKAFTLIEVNLAMLIMAGGILSIIGLYSFGFRENAQSREDVSGSAAAGLIIAPLVAAFSQTNNVWSSMQGEFTYPANGWKSYLSGSDYKVKTDPRGQAASAFSAALGKCKNAEGSFPGNAINSSGLTCALVVHHDKGSGIVSIAVRTVNKNRYTTLMSQPLYYTEVRFQGEVQ